jgi:tRNA G18 (ribose-2'-O)-methylase SpoU/ribosomal protein S18 acetylase RimI-like enzyme
MVRIATVNDAEQLNILNDEFNGESETSIDNIRNSLMNNKQEVVIVADEDDMLVGFVCVQLKKSFCYDEYMPEITEVYVKPAYRKRGLASEMITFAEAYCSKNYPLHQYELLTGQENLVAQTVYNKLGYVDDNELHLSKRVKTERVYTRSATYQKFEVLKTNRNKRYKYGEFFVEGVRNINNAVENGWEIVSFLYDGDRKLSDWARDKLAAVRTQVNYALRGDLLAALSGKADTSELLAVVKMRDDDFSRIPLSENPLIALFDRPSNHGNLGTILRSCDALGVEGLILTGHGVDLYDPDVVSSTMGSFFCVPAVRMSDNDSVFALIDALKARYPGFQVVGTTAHHEKTLSEVDFTKPTMLLIGNETEGLRRIYKERSDVLATIPMNPRGSASSLNVACAATVMFYEAVRQRAAATCRGEVAGGAC